MEEKKKEPDEEIEKLISQAGSGAPNVYISGRSAQGLAFEALARLLAKNYDVTKSQLKVIKKLTEIMERATKSQDEHSRKFADSSKRFEILTVILAILTLILVLKEIGMI